MIKKGIVLAAGKGSRLFPLTLAIPKEMIRVGVKPAIEHAINVLKAGGVSDILIIVGRNKEAIFNYLGSGKRLGVQISYRIQEELLGTADATYYGKDFVQNEDFALIYGDNYLKPYNVMKEVVKVHEESNADATLVLSLVKDPRQHGIVKIDKEGWITRMIEKPTLNEARPFRHNRKYLSIAGLMILKPIIFRYIKKTKPGKNGEIWLTDTLELMRRDGKRVRGFIFNGERYDIGTLESLIEADKLEYKNFKK